MSDRILNSTIQRRFDLEAAADPRLRAVGARLFTMGETRIIVTREPQGWHLSISCESRDPTWDEIVTARYRLLPDVHTAAMLFPPLKDYVNIHPHTFHLYEVPKR